MKWSPSFFFFLEVDWPLSRKLQSCSSHGLLNRQQGKPCDFDPPNLRFCFHFSFSFFLLLSRDLSRPRDLRLVFRFFFFPAKKK